MPGPSPTLRVVGDAGNHLSRSRQRLSASTIAGRTSPCQQCHDVASRVPRGRAPRFRSRNKRCQIRRLSIGAAFKARPGVAVGVGRVDRTDEILWQAVLGLVAIEGYRTGWWSRTPPKSHKTARDRHGLPPLAAFANRPRTIAGSSEAGKRRLCVLHTIARALHGGVLDPDLYRCIYKFC